MRWQRFLSLAAVAVAITAGAFVLGAQGQEPQPLNASDIADGMRLYQQKGNCQACHGWAGDGRKTDSQMPDGANLHETKLDSSDGLADGNSRRPGRGMTAFDKYAKSEAS